ncbi:polyprenyl synthetase family protein [Desulforamulus hydrothermalis]|uniref:Farnesyl diphosphate synthase n=1 Tax=Desulforamulus hydrothermalis Lam5 = DSM 18033 TaxID=1121428 RepID=K8E0F8_9FIRM|nr:farnesyl diphosphate synthase [Desulforamulus hydrothermalis]CCO08925.1 Farnesyl diphosphate synthase [Desulforamulus hydrothermalis Lam5 = DSM 18033]SHG74910.1 farnesyl-diphosphate synthase [Desulforamulus hydrothermalis Lam5 = DSM 18033]
MSFKEQLTAWARQVDEALHNYLPPADAYPAVLHEAMRYSVFAGGKRLRPILVLAAAKAVGGNTDKIMPVACALELIHTYSLVHDDLPAMDNDDYRRGRPTNHKVYGEATAILVGDALLTLAFELVARCGEDCPPAAVNRVAREIAQAAGSRGLIGGQVVDLLSENKQIESSVLEYIHRHKTGALFRAAVRAGAILGGAGEAQLAALTTYAEQMGLAFQIKDDLLDIEGDEAKIGKPVGSDIKNQKVTYPSLYGLDGARRMADEAAREAVTALNIFGPEAEFLRLMMHFIINRDH